MTTSSPGWTDPVTGLTSGPIAEPVYPHRCQHCDKSIRLMPNGAYEDEQGFMRCQKDLDHVPLPTVDPTKPYDLTKTDPIMELGERVLQMLAAGYSGQQIVAAYGGVTLTQTETALHAYTARILRGTIPPPPAPECGNISTFNGWCYRHGVFHPTPDVAARPPAYRCTGLTAAWCPVHGDCRCFNGLDGTHCPLHGPTSTHARGDDDAA